MKRILSLLLAAAMTLSLVACQTQKQPQQQPDDGGEVTDLPNAGEGARLLAAKYPDYPDFVDFEAFGNDWEKYSAADEAARKQIEEIRGAQPQTEALMPFSRESMSLLLSGADAGENRVYSPANLYLALAMLSEVTAGASREEILHLLGAQSVESLRSQSEAVWRNLYQEDGKSALRLANSFWLDEDIVYHALPLQILAENHFASSFQGQMGSEALNAALQDWLNEQTGGLLKDATQSVTTQKETLLALASTVYFKDGWSNTFDPAQTAEDIFTRSDGTEVTCEFLHDRRNGSSYVKGEGYTAISRGFSGSGCSMVLVLPDEGVSVDALLAEEGLWSVANGNWHEAFAVKNTSVSYGAQELLLADIKLSLPKFDVSAQMDLADCMKTMGVQTVFDDDAADFSPLTDLPAVLSSAQSAARVMIDEDGCEAASYVVMMVATTGAMPQNLPVVELDFDRPFLFFITGLDGLPLFSGVVNTPVE